MIESEYYTARKSAAYRNLNVHPVNMIFPIQNYREIVGCMVGKNVFGTLGLLQILLALEALKLTTFATLYS